MIEQRSVLELLSDQPVTETANWILGEPSVEEVLVDPVVHALLRRDGLRLDDLQRAIAFARRRLDSGLAVRAMPSSDAA